MVSKRSAEIVNAFTRYVKTSNRSEIENVKKDELEDALAQYALDKNMPFYHAMELHLEKVREEERYKRTQMESMSEGILLEQEQEKLLCALVEAARNVPGEKRSKFIAVAVMGGSFIQHPGLPQGRIPAYQGDAEVLAHVGLVLGSYSSQGNLIFDVSPLGFRYYKYLKERNGQPIQELESTTRNYLNSDQFQRKYSDSYQKWVSAET